jgi:hypothetical protein
MGFNLVFPKSRDRYMLVHEIRTNLGRFPTIFEGNIVNFSLQFYYFYFLWLEWSEKIVNFSTKKLPEIVDIVTSAPEEGDNP